MELGREVSEIKAIVTRLDKHVMGNGQPGLEQRLGRDLGARIDQVERHCKRNMEEGDGNLHELIQQETEARNKQHDENKAARAEDKKEREAVAKKLDRLTYIVTLFMGALMCLKYLEDAGLLKGLR